MTSLFLECYQCNNFIGFARCLFLSLRDYFSLSRRNLREFKDSFRKRLFFELLYFNVARIDLFMRDPDRLESGFSIILSSQSYFESPKISSANRHLFVRVSRFARRDFFIFFFIFSSDSILAAGRSPGKFTLNRIILERASDKLRPCARYSPECV